MTAVFFLVMIVCAAPVVAQTYVSATLGADINKSYESTTNGTTFPEGGGEAIGWGLRVGTTLGSRWGVELEFNRPGVVESEFNPIIYADLGATVPAVISRISPGSGSPLPSFDLAALLPTLQVRTEQRNTTWNAAAWVRQPIGDRADLVFLGGVGFSRVAQETDYSVGAVRGARVSLLPHGTEIVSYGVGPLVGAEARIRMTEQLTFTPGLRVQSLGNDLAAGVLLRPSIALGWTF